MNHIRVHDAMHRGILSCAADAPLGKIAGIMANHREREPRGGSRGRRVRGNGDVVIDAQLSGA